MITDEGERDPNDFIAAEFLTLAATALREGKHEEARVYLSDAMYYVERVLPEFPWKRP